MAIMIVGLGRLGSRIAERLDGEELILVDFDLVQADNLDEQPFYSPDDVGKHKVVAAREKLQNVRTLAVPFTKDTPLDGVTRIYEGTDSLHARLIINDAAKRAGIPAVFSTAAKDAGMVFRNGEACWQCITKGKRAVDDCASGIEPRTMDAVADAALAAAPDMLVRVRGTEASSFSVARNPGCMACRGTYSHLDEPFTVRFCPGTRRLQARPSSPRQVALDSLSNVAESFPTARRITVGAGTALVHQHGLIEFENVSVDEAKAVTQLILGARPV